MPDAWKLDLFYDRLEDWAAERVLTRRERDAVSAWLDAVRADPRRAGKQADMDKFDNLWFALIPGTLNDAGEWLTCTYFIHFAERVAQCAHWGWVPGPFLEYPELA